jgi:Kef-type K+ transport system membrane component KefB
MIVAAALSYLLKILKQPQILAYVITGVLITPILGIVTDLTTIQSMSTIGIAFLLFLVGLEIDIKKLRSVALVSTLGGLIYALVIFIIGYFVSLLLGFITLEAAYIGLMLSFSSTMVVMKLLSDQRELGTLHGRIVVGLLLVQDIIAIFALSVMTTSNGFGFAALGLAAIKFLALFGLAVLSSLFLFPSVFKFAAKKSELLFIASLAVCFIYSLIFYYLGFSIAIGAFIGGLALGNLEYNFEIIARVRSLRDFFSVLFFVSLGMGLSIGVLQDMLLPLIVIFLLTIFLKPLVIMTVCSMFKYTKKPSFLAANSLGQVGEFSMIMAAQGVALGHLSANTLSLIVMVALLSITFTSYTIEKSKGFYKLLKKPLKIFEIFTTQGLEYLPTEVQPTIVLCGHNRIGYSILHNLQKVKKKVLVVDYNPEIITRMVKEGYHCLYGDATDEEIIERMDLRKIKMLISTIPELKGNVYLIKKLREHNKSAKIITTAEDIDAALKLYEVGADYVILPHFLGGEHASNLITNIRRRKVSLKMEKIDHITNLKQRQEIGQEHPKQ